MKEYQQKHFLRTLIYGKASMLFLFILIILLLRSIIELSAKRVEVARLRDESAKERTLVEQKLDRVRKDTDFIATPRGYEAYIRTTYPIVKDGEGVIVVYDDQKSPVSSVREDMTLREKVIIWWKKFFVYKEK